MLIGYARVSTQDQTLNLQKDALEKQGCNKIFTDTASGAKAERKGLEEALEHVREGDTLVVWRLGRLGVCRTFTRRVLSSQAKRAVW
jgi:DNA invertase Pin-like site-specific DNA recombinase